MSIRNVTDQFGSKKKGFTLVEILVAMAIAMVLSALAVNGYLTYRKSTLLDLSADNIVAQIFALRSKTIHGDVGGDRLKVLKEELGGDPGGAVIGDDGAADGGGGAVDGDGGAVDGDGGAVDGGFAGSRCFGLYFQKTADGFDLKSFSQTFVDKQVWGGVSSGWVYQGCGDFDPLTVAVMDFELDEQINVVSATDNLGNEFGDDLVLRFVPPNGVMEFRENFGSGFRSEFASDETVRVRIRYGTTADTKYQRDIFLDLFNLKADVKNVETT